jgi:hypothetical protein
MPSSGMLRRVALLRIDDSEERTSSMIRIGRISEITTMLAIASKCFVPSSIDFCHPNDGVYTFLRHFCSCMSHKG